MKINNKPILGEYTSPSSRAFIIESLDIVCGSENGFGAMTHEFEDDPDYILF